MFKMEDYAISNQGDSLDEIMAKMKALQYEIVFATTKYRTEGRALSEDCDVYQMWRHKDTGFTVMTVVAPLGEILVYRLDKIRLEDL